MKKMLKRQIASKLIGALDAMSCNRMVVNSCNMAFFKESGEIDTIDETPPELLKLKDLLAKDYNGGQFESLELRKIDDQTAGFKITYSVNGMLKSTPPEILKL